MKKLSKQEQKIIIMAGDFKLKLLKVLDNARYGKRSDKEDLSNHILNNIADLIKYTNLVIGYNFKKAANFDMDSAVRDMIPDVLFNSIEEYRTENTKNKILKENPYSKSGMGM